MFQRILAPPHTKPEQIFLCASPHSFSGIHHVRAIETFLASIKTCTETPLVYIILLCCCSFMYIYSHPGLLAILSPRGRRVQATFFSTAAPVLRLPVPVRLKERPRKQNSTSKCLGHERGTSHNPFLGEQLRSVGASQSEKSSTSVGIYGFFAARRDRLFLAPPRRHFTHRKNVQCPSLTSPSHPSSWFFSFFEKKNILREKMWKREPASKNMKRLSGFNARVGRNPKSASELAASHPTR